MIIALQIVLCLGTVVAQATLSTWLSVNNIYPDLCLILACIVGFLTNEYKGLMIGLTIGLFQDLLAPGGIGLNMILKGLAGFLAGVTTHTVSAVTTAAVVIVTLVLSLGCGLASLIVAYPVLDGPDALHAISWTLAIQALYNSLLAAGIFWLTHKVRHSFGVVHFAQGRR
jgi:cell shape-determining protein MreD